MWFNALYMATKSPTFFNLNRALTTPTMVPEVLIVPNLSRQDLRDRPPDRLVLCSLVPVLYFPYLSMQLCPYHIIQPEFARAYYVLKEKVEMIVASPGGSEAPLDSTSVMFENDPACMEFLNEIQSLWKTTRKLSDVLAEAEELMRFS